MKKLLIIIRLKYRYHVLGIKRFGYGMLIKAVRSI